MLLLFAESSSSLKDGITVRTGNGEGLASHLFFYQSVKKREQR